MDPDQTAPRGAVLSGSTLFAKSDCKNHKQMTKQMTIVVIGSLRVKLLDLLTNHMIFVLQC